MRLKIIAGNLVAVLLLGLVSYSVVGGDLRKEVTSKVMAQIGNDQALLERSLRLTAFEFVLHVKDRASDVDVRQAFKAFDEAGRRTRAYDAAERSATWFGDPARGRRGRPHLVALTDESGKVLARDTDRNRMYGTQLDQQIPAVRETLNDGESRHDVWKKDDEGKLLEVAVAAVRNEAGQIVGALVVGYDLSNGLASAEGTRLGGRDVAFLVDDKVYSSSLNEAMSKQLRGYLFGEAKAVTNAAYGGNVSTPWVVSADDAEYAGVVAPLPEAHSVRVAYAVLADRTSDVKKLIGATKIILGLTLVFSLVVLAYGFVVGNTIVRPIEEIEEGVLAVINGNTELRLDTGNTDLGGLAYRINQLLNVFTGVAEAAAEAEEDGENPAASSVDWKDTAFTEPGGTAPPIVAAPTSNSGAGNDPLDDPALARTLEAEAEAAYYHRVFEEYAAAKRATGENFAVPEDRFTQRLKGNEQALAQKHGVRSVRFQVRTQDGHVNLQPVLIR